MNLTNLCTHQFPKVPSHVTCSSFYTCKGRGKNYCVAESELCDGKPQCQYGDDENGILCNKRCPNGCTCTERRWKCNGWSLPNIPLIIPYIDLSGHAVDINIVCSQYRTYLMYLDLSHAGLDDISCLSGQIFFPALRELDLSDNNIQLVPMLKLPSLKIIRLNSNPILKIELNLILNEVHLSNDGIYDISWFKDTDIHNDTDVFENCERNGSREPDVSLLLSICNVRILDLSRNKLQHFTYFGHCIWLRSLDLQHNEIQTLSYHSFNGLRELETLYLNDNMLTSIDDAHFLGLRHLTSLWLQNNMISAITEGTFYDLESLSTLNLSMNNIRALNLNIFSTNHKLIHLELQNNQISTIGRSLESALDGLIVLNLRNNNISYINPGLFKTMSKLDILDLRQNDIMAVTDIFTGLGVLQTLYVDSFTLCCFKPTSVHQKNCFAPADVFSSCSNLIDVGLLHICIWLTALLSILGNIIALSNRIRAGTWIKESRDILVSNLCISDLLMGIYLLIVAYEDVQTRGNYGEHHSSWRNGRLCQIGGTLVTASSEMSTLCIFAITLDRYILFKYLFVHKEKARRNSLVAVTLMWIFSVLVAIIPDYCIWFFGENYYGRSSVCISLPLTQITLKFKAWEYSVALFIVFNLLVYCLVVLGQVAIFLQIRKNSSCIQDEKKKKREVAVAKSLFFVVVSNTICWLPVAVIGKFIRSFRGKDELV